MHKANHALQYSIYRHDNANSSSRLKTLIRYKIQFKKNMLFKCHHVIADLTGGRKLCKATVFNRF